MAVFGPHIVPVAGGAAGAPTDANYLVGTANGDLSAEIVVGTTPGGELGGTWAAPTVDATHSGSSHAGVQAAAEATAAAALSSHVGAADPHVGYVLESLYDANTILKADADNTPAALTMGASTILARLAAGNIVAATPSELRTLLALVVGTNVQAWDADLDSLASVGLTAAGLALLDDVNAAAQRVTLGIKERDLLLSPATNAIASNFPRVMAATNGAALVSGTTKAVSIGVLAGDVVTSLSFISATTAFSSRANSWFALYDYTTTSLIRQSTDQLTNAWSANSLKTLALDSVPVLAGSRSGSTTVTLTIHDGNLLQTAAEMFAAGDSVVVSNANIAAYNGTFTIDAVTTTTITYTCGGSATDSLTAPFPTVQLAASKRAWTVPTNRVVFGAVMCKGTVPTLACYTHLSGIKTIEPLPGFDGDSSLTGTAPTLASTQSSVSLIPYAVIS